MTSSREALNEGGTPGSEKIFVIGGLQIYTLFLESGLDIELWISHIPGTHEGDVFFPEYLDRFEPYESKKYDSFDFIKYKAKN